MSEPKSKKSRDASKSKDKEKEKEKDKEKDSKKSKDKKSKDKDPKSEKSEPNTPAKGRSRASLGDSESKPSQPQFITSSKLCIHHEQTMTYFCDSCQEPVCNQCTVIGPHNNQLHRLIDLQTAFRTQSQAFNVILHMNLLPKRDQLRAQIYRLDYRVGEIKYVKTCIERDIRTEYEGMLETLTSMQGTKDVILRHDVESLRRDIEKIDEIIEIFSTHTKDSSDPLPFLSKYTYLKDLVQYTLGKDFKRNIDIVATDFPNELPKRKATLEKYKAFEQVSGFKDKVVSEIVEKSSERIEKVKEEFDKAASEEVEQWAKLTDNLSQQLKKFKTICYYCGCNLNEVNVNTICRANRKAYYPLGYGYTIEIPDNDWHKTARHFFGKPRPDLLKKEGFMTPRKGDDELLKKSPLKDKEARIPYQTFLDVIFTKIIRQCNDKDLSLGNLIQNQDPKNTGTMSFISFSYLLNEYCALDQIELEKLREVVDPLDKNIVHYQNFIDMINDFQGQ